MSNVKIAVVTGSNRGIGFGIVKGLCERFKGKVYLTSRDISKGAYAIKKLNTANLKPLYHQLDVTDEESLEKFRDHILKLHGGIDLLFNNAGIGFADDAPQPFSQQAEETLKVNYYGLLKTCQVLFPILRENARVVNISSSLGHLHWIPSDELKEKFRDPSLNLDKLNKLMEKFVSDAIYGKHKEAGWGDTNDCTYIVSKVGITALTMIQQKELDAEVPNRNIAVNCVHPGYVYTELTGFHGKLTIEEGSEAPLFLGLEDHGFKGKYVWCDKTPMEWHTGIPPSRD